MKFGMIEGMKNNITSIDVARLAQVSQSAVSRTFTPGASVAEATRAKVLEAALRLNYRPNAHARSLITGKSRIIGLVLSYLENLFYPAALQRLSERLQKDGYHVLLFINQTSNADDLITCFCLSIRHPMQMTLSLKFCNTTLMALFWRQPHCPQTLPEIALTLIFQWFYLTV